MKQEFFTVIPQNMREYKMSIREADNENDIFRMAFEEVMKGHGFDLNDSQDLDSYMLAWDSFKDGWEAAVRILNDDSERSDGRTAGTAPEAWQPIETAPKDGREVLLYLGEPYSRIAKAFWHAPWENWQEGEVPHDHDEYGGIGSACPTHWMPLPAAPSLSGTEDAKP